MWKLILLMLKLVCFLPVGIVSADEQNDVSVRILTFPGGRQEDGFWTAIGAGRDGRVYIGLVTHGGSSQFYVYDPGVDAIRHIAMIQQKVGEMDHRTEPQAKLHSQILEDAEGRIWFGTDMGAHSYFAMWDDPKAYPGGHMMMYDPKTDVLHDLGIPFPRHAIRHIAMDKDRQKLYVVTFPTGLFGVYDMKSGRAAIKGRVNNWDSIARVMVLDDQGNVYGSFAPYRIFKYDVKADRLIDLPVTIPYRDGPWNDRGHGHRENIWRNAAWHFKQKVIYGVEQGSSTFFRFDPQTNKIENLGQMVRKELIGQRIVPYTSHGFALHPNGKIYYTAPSKGLNEPVLLIEYDTETGRRRDLGPMTDQENGIPVDLQGASVGPDGTLYFAGWVRPKGAIVNPAKKRSGTVFGLVILSTGELR